MSVTLTDLTARFWTKVTVDPDSNCWLWTGALNSRGYGQWAVEGVSKSIHRLTYEAFRGDIPEGLTIDHLCRVKHCCNPWHMEVVTVAVNNQRKVGAGSPSATHCLRGHEYTPENTAHNGAGNRYCRTCNNARKRKHPEGMGRKIGAAKRQERRRAELAAALAELESTERAS